MWSLPFFVGRCGLCATTLFSDGGTASLTCSNRGIYNAVFIRRPQNLHRLSAVHTAPKNKTADKIKRRIKRKAKLNGGRFALATPYIISIGYISPLILYPPLISKSLTSITKNKRKNRVCDIRRHLSNKQGIIRENHKIRIRLYKRLTINKGFIR